MTSADQRAAGLRELTIRGMILGGLITLLFTAANVYLGLKVGLTFATSIPAAVISMAILRQMSGSTILENNIVQTIASAAGTLAAIIFVLPGLVMVGYWQNFPLLETTAITMLGGILGVLFSIPLRRALVVDADLPYPEGRAAAEVLRVGAASAEGAEENAAGLSALLWNSVIAAGFALLTQMKLAAAEVARWFKVGAGATGVAGGLGFALFGVGHLVGLSVGLAQLVGLVTGWWVLLPILTQGVAGPDAETIANTVFRDNVRFFGAGVIAVAALWTLLKIAGPVIGGIRSALAASRARNAGTALAVEEQDISIGWVFGGSLLTLFPISWLLWSVLADGPLAGSAAILVAGALLFIIVVGLMIASVTGYMAGLIGASNSPVSGIGILAIIASSLLLVGLLGRGSGDAGAAMIAYALIVTGVVFGIATISNDNLQDLKTGQLVGATPWKQQVALIIGVVFGSLVVPPVLNVLNETVGFVGVPGAGPNALAAPQAGLISSLAKGVLGGDLNWTMLGYGVFAGVGFIVVDEILGRAGKLRLPPLAVGIGIYLPMSVILPVVVGAIGGWFYDRWADRRINPEFARRMGVLTATGMIVGDSLFGVFYAGAVYVTDKDSPLAVVGDGFGLPSIFIGLGLFTASIILSYARTRKLVETTA
ncbi:oligopeptide transporter, OPT family [Sphingopyxis indica]|uniref:OPT family oligopeptide transporter n=1 Tax=Sphingopyxis indica TaxID=436663 RepID=UPI002938F25A|nr:oligopeptide transporter, OPT family [Sphingopyxis indica]WOF41825.1 oligopeptide transporter, OPT family [Sphingopyxis indica]